MGVGGMGGGGGGGGGGGFLSFLGALGGGQKKEQPSFEQSLMQLLNIQGAAGGVGGDSFLKFLQSLGGGGAQAAQGIQAFLGRGAQAPRNPGTIPGADLHL